MIEDPEEFNTLKGEDEIDSLLNIVEEVDSDETLDEGEEDFVDPLVAKGAPVDDEEIEDEEDEDEEEELDEEDDVDDIYMESFEDIDNF